MNATRNTICGDCPDVTLSWRQRLAIVGNNGSGKSSLLKLLHGSLMPQAGRVIRQDGLRMGYVPQIVEGASGLSGGQAVNRALSLALAAQPDLLLLDEPTNHLDADNRQSLRCMLHHCYGSIVLVIHDTAMLNEVCDTVWHIEQGKIQIFPDAIQIFCQILISNRKDSKSN